MGELDGRVALVTGVGAGMGSAIAAAYAAAGATVVGADINAEAGAAVMQRIGGSSSFVVGDVSQVGECQGLVDHVLADHDRLDVVVNNAGVTRSPSASSTSPRTTGTGSTPSTPRGCSSSCRPRREVMRDHGHGGRIVNIASIAGKGYRGTSNVAYAGSKGAVIAMTRISAAQLARWNITSTPSAPA